MEEIKWGFPHYSVDDKGVVAIVPYSDHVNLQFYKGALLKSKFLEGTGKFLRHIKVFSKKNIRKKNSQNS